VKLLAAVVAVLVACGAPQSKPPPIANTAEAKAGLPGAGKVYGTLYDDDGNALVGATVVLMDEDALTMDPEDDYVSISNENGRYEIPAEVEAGHYVLTIYYADISAERELDVSGATIVDQHIPIREAGGMRWRCVTAELASCK
jgi:hypothetical protein